MARRLCVLLPPSSSLHPHFSRPWPVLGGEESDGLSWQYGRHPSLTPEACGNGRSPGMNPNSQSRVSNFDFPPSDLSNSLGYGNPSSGGGSNRLESLARAPREDRGTKC